MSATFATVLWLLAILILAAWLCHDGKGGARDPRA
jgi:hypothetical protein